MDSYEYRRSAKNMRLIDLLAVIGADVESDEKGGETDE